MTDQTRRDKAKMVLANWKASLSPHQARQWLADFKGLYRPFQGLEVILALPVLFLPDLQNQCRDLENVSLAAQDVSPFPQGGYTGSTPAAWLNGMVDYVLVGHRERRRYFHETVQDSANKVSEALAEELCPVLCSDRETVRSQLAAIDSSELDKLILAYTPDDAEALEVAGKPGAVAAEADRFAEMSGKRPVLYGGGVNRKNVADFIGLDSLAGVMCAKGCLDPREFVELLENAGRALA